MINVLMLGSEFFAGVFQREMTPALGNMPWDLAKKTPLACFVGTPFM
jgi:hypothetical protein